MSISQLDDPAMRTALGIETDTPSQLTSPVQIGSVTLTDQTNGLLALTNTQTGGVGGLRLGAVPAGGNFAQLSSTGLTFADVNGVTFQTLQWDNNTNNTTLTAGTNGDVVLLNAGAGTDVISSIGGVQDGTAGHALSFAASSGRLWVGTSGQLNFNHLTPATSTGNQILFRPSFCEAVSAATTPVGAGGQVIIPLTSLVRSSSQGGQPMWGISGGNSVQLQANNTDAGLFFVTAVVAIDTVTAGAQVAAVHFRVNGTDVPNSTSTHTVNATQQASIVVQTYLQLNPTDAISLVLSSADVAMSATSYPAVVGPPAIPAELACVLTAFRVA